MGRFEGEVKFFHCCAVTNKRDAARWMGLDNPRSAMVFGGLAGTVSGVTAGLAATDRRLVPYGALTATFHTGLGCLLGPSLLYFIVRGIVG
jgi:malonate transporter MadM subunit